MITIKMQPFPCPRIGFKGRFTPRAKAYYSKIEEFRLKVKLSGFKPEDTIEVHFIFDMPKSWSNKKKELMDGKPHQQTPDLDNCQKSCLDAIYNGHLGGYENGNLWKTEDDKTVWKILATKTWGQTGSITLSNK